MRVRGKGGKNPNGPSQQKDRMHGEDLTNNLRLALAYFTVIRQNTSSGLLEQGKYRGRQICENMLNLLTAVISPCKSTQPQQAAKLPLKTTPGEDCALSSGQKKKKKEREFHKSLQRRVFRADEETGFKKSPTNCPPGSECLSRIPGTRLALGGRLQQ